MINYASREINIKIVYYGCGLSGKTTCLQYIHSKTDPNKRGKFTSFATEEDRTIFFDLLPMEVGTVGGFKIRLGLYTVPGQVYYASSRKLVLTGAQGVIFVADSQKERIEANIHSMEDLERNLIEQNTPLEILPFLIMYNKRDLPNILSVSELQKKLNYRNAPYFESIATKGPGVFPALKKMIMLTVYDVINRYKIKVDNKEKDKLDALTAETKDNIEEKKIPHSDKVDKSSEPIVVKNVENTIPEKSFIDSTREVLQKSEIEIISTKDYILQEDKTKDVKDSISTSGIVLENFSPIPDLIPTIQEQPKEKIDNAQIKTEIKNIIIKHKLNSEEILCVSTKLLQLILYRVVNKTPLSEISIFHSREFTNIDKSLSDIIAFVEKNRIEIEKVNDISAFLFNFAFDKKIEEKK